MCLNVIQWFETERRDSFQVVKEFHILSQVCDANEETNAARELKAMAQ
jgi:hypothetical protein